MKRILTVLVLAFASLARGQGQFTLNIPNIPQTNFWSPWFLANSPTATDAVHNLNLPAASTIVTNGKSNVSFDGGMISSDGNGDLTAQQIVATLIFGTVQGSAAGLTGTFNGTSTNSQSLGGLTASGYTTNGNPNNVTNGGNAILSSATITNLTPAGPINDKLGNIVVGVVGGPKVTINTNGTVLGTFMGDGTQLIVSGTNVIDTLTNNTTGAAATATNAQSLGGLAASGYTTNGNPNNVTNNGTATLTALNPTGGTLNINLGAGTLIGNQVTVGTVTATTLNGTATNANNATSLGGFPATTYITNNATFGGNLTGSFNGYASGINLQAVSKIFFAIGHSRSVKLAENASGSAWWNYIANPANLLLQFPNFTNVAVGATGTNTYGVTNDAWGRSTLYFSPAGSSYTGNNSFWDRMLQKVYGTNGNNIKLDTACCIPGNTLWNTYGGLPVEYSLIEDQNWHGNLSYAANGVLNTSGLTIEAGRWIRLHVLTTNELGFTCNGNNFTNLIVGNDYTFYSGGTLGSQVAITVWGTPLAVYNSYFYFGKYVSEQFNPNYAPPYIRAQELVNTNFSMVSYLDSNSPAITGVPAMAAIFIGGNDLLLDTTNNNLAYVRFMVYDISNLCVHLINEGFPPPLVLTEEITPATVGVVATNIYLFNSLLRQLPPSVCRLLDTAATNAAGGFETATNYGADLTHYSTNGADIMGATVLKLSGFGYLSPAAQPIGNYLTNIPVAATNPFVVSAVFANTGTTPTVTGGVLTIPTNVLVFAGYTDAQAYKQGTNAVNAISNSGDVSTNAANLTLVFTPTGTNDIKNIAQSAVLFTNTTTDVIVASNLVIGVFYTNNYNTQIEIKKVRVVPILALVSGNVSCSLELSGVDTNTFYEEPTVTLIGSMSGPETNALAGFTVAPGGIFRFVDTSSGAGNSVSLSLGSQIVVKGGLTITTGANNTANFNSANIGSPNITNQITITSAAPTIAGIAPQLTSATLSPNATYWGMKMAIITTSGTQAAATNYFYITNFPAGMIVSNYNPTFSLMGGTNLSSANATAFRATYYNNYIAIGPGTGVPGTSTTWFYSLVLNP